MIRRALPVLLILALGLTACDLHISLPFTQKTGPTVVDEIVVPLPAEAGSVALSLGFGTGTLKLHPGSEPLVSGTATYNISDFKPTITSSGTTIRIEQGNYRLTGIPDFTNIKNEWDLSLGVTPLDLEIDAGAYEAEYQFGGLALTNLTIEDGAAEVDLDFSTPNTAEMILFRYETGASNVTMTGLANANFSSMLLNCGAGNYTLDFTGDLQRDASVSIQTGVSNIALAIPEGVPVQITVDGGLSNVTMGAGWAKNGNVYTQAGSGFELVFVIEIGAGNVTLTR